MCSSNCQLKGKKKKEEEEEDVNLKSIVCLAYMLYLMVKDALGLGSAVKATRDAASLEVWSLLETCWYLANQFSCSIKSAHLLRERRWVGGWL